MIQLAFDQIVRKPIGISRYCVKHILTLGMRMKG